MKKLVVSLQISATTAALILFFFACTPRGDSSKAPVDTLPRTADGKPDLSGIWQSFSTATWGLEDHVAQKGEPAGQSVVEGGAIPYQEWALEKRKENYQNRMKADPVRQCYMPGVPRVTYMPFPFQIVQTPSVTIITYEYNHLVRWLWSDGRPHPRALDFWMGESRATWDGDALTVDVQNNNDSTWFDAAGDFHSDALRVIERYTLANPNQINYEATIEDTKVFTRPWKISLPLYRRVEKNLQLLDYECLEFETPFLGWDEAPAPGFPMPPRR